jgi:YVTN family beta-propeller protein
MKENEEQQMKLKRFPGILTYVGQFCTITIDKRGEKMKKRVFYMTCLTMVLLLVTPTLAQSGATKAPGYHLIKKIVIGNEGFWDYLALDTGSRILYISHGTVVELLNIDTGVKGEPISELQGVHGIAFAHKLGRGYISNGKANTVTVFDLKTRKKLAEVKTGTNPDAILYDEFSNRVFTFNGRSADATVIDVADNTAAGTIALGGKPEFAISGDNGTIFVNIEDTSEIVVIDSKGLQVLRRWKLTPGEEPSGLAFDPKNKRLFSVCSNKLMVVSDSETGTIITTVPIGEGPDAARCDSQTGLVFSSNGEGTLTVIGQESADKYRVLETVPTARGARTMEIDPKTHHIFVVTAEFGPIPAASPENPHPRPAIVPGSFKILEFGM